MQFFLLFIHPDQKPSGVQRPNVPCLGPREEKSVLTSQNISNKELISPVRCGRLVSQQPYKHTFDELRYKAG